MSIPVGDFHHESPDSDSESCVLAALQVINEATDKSQHQKSRGNGRKRRRSEKIPNGSEMFLSDTMSLSPQMPPQMLPMPPQMASQMPQMSVQMPAPAMYQHQMPTHQQHYQQPHYNTSHMHHYNPFQPQHQMQMPQQQMGMPQGGYQHQMFMSPPDAVQGEIETSKKPKRGRKANGNGSTAAAPRRRKKICVAHVKTIICNEPEEPEDVPPKKQYFQREWMSWYHDLLRFCETYGHGNVPATYEDAETGAKLGSWLTNQRRYYKKNQLSKGRVLLLQKLVDQGKLWWDLNREESDTHTWDCWYHDLLAYERMNGHCNVPVQYKMECGRKLGQWLNNQKRLRRVGKLKPERENPLQILVDARKMVW